MCRFASPALRRSCRDSATQDSNSPSTTNIADALYHHHADVCSTNFSSIRSLPEMLAAENSVGADCSPRSNKSAPPLNGRFTSLSRSISLNANHCVSDVADRLRAFDVTAAVAHALQPRFPISQAAKLWIGSASRPCRKSRLKTRFGSNKTPVSCVSVLLNLVF